jgi:hypothetical protein
MSSMDDALWACDITNWYKNQNLTKLTFPTRFVDLPDGFIDRMLRSEGLFARVDQDGDFGNWSDDDWNDNESGEPDGDEELDQRRDRQQETYPEFEKQIKAVIDRWTISGAEGGVFPRVNWSSPMDAHWMGIGGSLRCTTVAEVMRFLEASDSVRGDLELLEDLKKRQAGDRSWKPQLALRKWHEFHTPNEFRCFVAKNHLIAVSQKDVSNFWPFLVDSKQSHLQSLFKFFEEKVKDSMEIDSCMYLFFKKKNIIIFD